MDKKQVIIKSIIIIFLLIISVASIFGISPLSYLIDSLKWQIIVRREELSIQKEKGLDINSSNDLIGVWKEIDCDFNNRFEAIIDSESITIYKYDNSINNIRHNVLYKNIYWAGTFDLDLEIDKESVIISHNFNIITDGLNDMSYGNQIVNHSKEMRLIYNNGSIMFLSQYRDEYRNIVLKRFDTRKRKPMSDLLELKYIGDRTSKFDTNNNFKIDLNNYEIEIPYYFDNVESESLEYNNQLKKIPDGFDTNEVGGYMYNDRYIVRSPSDENSYAELFIGKYNNANIEDINDLIYFVDYYGEKQIDYDYYFGLKDYKNNIISHYYEVGSNILDGSISFLLDYLYINKYIDNRGGNAQIEKNLVYDTWVVFTDTNTLFCISLAYGYNDNSDNDYIEDYIKIINSLRIKQ